MIKTKTLPTDAKNICINCKHFNHSGYIEHELTKHVGFCSRFTETTPINDTCICFTMSTSKEEHFRNLEKAKQLNIQLSNQTFLEL